MVGGGGGDGGEEPMAPLISFLLFLIRIFFYRRLFLVCVSSSPLLFSNYSHTAVCLEVEEKTKGGN